MKSDQRLHSLFKGDVTFQVKYGFYFVYTVFTLFYVLLLFVFPESLRETAAAIMIYTDPAAMGLFFMGAIVLLEKSQRVLNSIAVSPVKVYEYILSKVISLGLISTLVGMIIAFCAKADNLLTAAVGIFLGSVIFSLFGLIVAVKVGSLNHFMVATVPLELLCFQPAIVYLFGYGKPYLLLQPGCIVIRMILGKNGFEPGLLLILAGWIVLIYLITYRAVKKMLFSVGGVKL
jgi:fluoroquinolone transport system permease protein